MDTSRDAHRQSRLRELISHLGLQQNQFAARAGIDPSYVSRLLYPPGKAGRKNLGLDTIDGIQAAFRLSAGWFDLPAGSAMPSTTVTSIDAKTRVEDKPANWAPPQWPFVNVTEAQYFTLHIEERMHIENDILLRIKTREPPAKQHPPESNGAAA
jgi:transcriptional regulator with XRE-family HTH domain